jgi:hypothetical protein
MAGVVEHYRDEVIANGRLSLGVIYVHGWSGGTL